MTVFAGHYGSIELKRLGASESLDLLLTQSDLDVTRKRFSLNQSSQLDLAIGTITTGDRVRITTEDSRGLPFRFYKNAANTVFVDNPDRGILPLEFYANVDAIGAIRAYRNFADAIANPGSRYLFVPLTKPVGTTPWSVKVSLTAGDYNTMGHVQGFTLSTERDTIDTTSLGNKYKNFSSSAISGGGTVDCLFSFKNLSGEEVPLALAQLIQKIEVGSRFAAKLYLLEPGLPQPRGYTLTEGVYYEVNGILSRSAFTLRADQVAECSFDFITSGEFVLRAGDNPVDLTTENNVSIGNESTLESLGVLEEAN